MHCKICNGPSSSVSPDRREAASYRFSIDPGVAMLLVSKTWALSSLGLPDQAAQVSELVRPSSPKPRTCPGTIARVTCNSLGIARASVRRFEVSERHTVEIFAFCAERKVDQFRRWGALYQASARAIRDPTEEYIVAIRGAIAANHRSGGYFSGSLSIPPCRSRVEGTIWPALKSRFRTASRSSSDPASDSGLPICIALKVGSHSGGGSRTKRGPRPVSAGPSRSPTGKKPVCSNFEPPPISRDYGAMQVRAAILARYWSRSSPRSRAARPPAISVTPARLLAEIAF